MCQYIGIFARIFARCLSLHLASVVLRNRWTLYINAIEILLIDINCLVGDTCISVLFITLN